jgi:hypothetical protein
MKMNYRNVNVITFLLYLTKVNSLLLITAALRQGLNGHMLQR